MKTNVKTIDRKNDGKGGKGKRVYERRKGDGLIGCERSFQLPHRIHQFLTETNGITTKWVEKNEK